MSGVTVFLWLVVAVVAIAGGMWIATRGRLGCGCPDDGRAVTACTVCGYRRCEERRYELHDCHEHAGHTR